jgi:hypothetical protein
VDAFPAATTPAKRMILIDRLMHQYHWALEHPQTENRPKGPSRPAAVNLIGGKAWEVLAFLDELSALGEPADATRAEARAEFRKNREASRAAWGWRER